MTVYLSNRDGNGKTSEEGHYKFTTNAFTGNVLNTADLAVTAQTPTATMKVNVAAGQYRIPDLSGTYAYTGWSDAVTEVTISTADAANPRITTIVMYVDKSAVTSASPANNPGITKFMAINGTPAASPVAPTNAAMQTAVGAANPYIILANVTLPALATTVITSYITDRRTFVKLNPSVLSASDIGQLMYPVGSLYVNTGNATNPATLLGFGTWAAFGEGRVIVGRATSGTFATNGSTGGAETHTLTMAQIPSFGFGFSHHGDEGGSVIRSPSITNGTYSGGSHGSYRPPAATTGGAGSAISPRWDFGSGQAHNNLQPYIVVYMWTRTA